MRFIIVTEVIEIPKVRVSNKILYEEAILNVNHIVWFRGLNDSENVRRDRNSEIQTTTGVLYARESHEDLIKLIIK